MKTMRDLLQADPHEYQRQYEAWVNTQFDYDWWDCVYEGFCEQHPEFDSDYRLFTFDCYRNECCIGGSLSLKYVFDKYNLWEEGTAQCLQILDYRSYVPINPRRSSMYMGDVEYWHSSYGACLFEGVEEEALKEIMDDWLQSVDLEKLCVEAAKDLAHELLKDLQAEYEWLSSEENFLEQPYEGELEMEQ